MTFLERLEQDYPLPFAASIWGNSTLTTLSSFVQNCLDDLQSDLEIYETVPASGITTLLPENTRAVTAVKLNVPFQGNRYVKWSYDSSTRLVHCRYLPAIIKYKRAVGLADLDTLKGSRLQYLKAYTLEKMLTKEISYLSSINLTNDAGDVDLTSLAESRDRFREQVSMMKDDIMIYSNS